MENIPRLKGKRLKQTVVGHEVHDANEYDSIAETMAFPRTSVQKRIARGCPEFFQDLCLGVLDQLKRNKKE
ncbi:MAG: hypothetical protein ACLP9L_30500 [Thermoguttaceae bacterium]